MIRTTGLTKEYLSSKLRHKPQLHQNLPNIENVNISLEIVVGEPCVCGGASFCTICASKNWRLALVDKELFFDTLVKINFIVWKRARMPTVSNWVFQPVLMFKPNNEQRCFAEMFLECFAKASSGSDLPLIVEHLRGMINK